MHSSQLRRGGFTTHAMKSAVAEGRLTRLRRSWPITPECSPTRRVAITCGGRTTCVTAAAEHGLWVPPHEGIHIAIPATASPPAIAGVVHHWSPGPAPVAVRSLCDPLLNVLHHVARCLPLADAIAVWESALRRRDTDAAVLAAVQWTNPAAREIASVASDLSDSGLESKFAELLRSLGVAFQQQVWFDGHPVDTLIGKRLVVQLDGFEHHRAADRRRDLRADARLVLRGYTVLRFDYQQVLFNPDYVRETIATAIAQGRHR